MSSARGSASAGPSRQTQSESGHPQHLRRSLRSASRASSVQSDNETQHVTRKTRRGRNAPPEAIAEDELEGQPKSSPRRGAARSAPPPTQLSTPARRHRVRHSLHGGQLQEMPLGSRVDMLSNVAGDCLAKLLKTSSVNDDSDLDGLRDDAQRSFEGLRGVLQKYIYSTEPPAYTDVDELMKSLDPFTRTTVARGDMDRAIWLANLATFVWAITYPDLAASLVDDEEAQDDKGKGKAKQIASSCPKDKIRRRNGVLIDAWKKFWLALGRTSVGTALSLWLDLATLIVLTYRLPTIDPFTAPNTALASPPEDLLKQLFSADALQKFGHLPVDNDTRQRWQAAAEERREELASETIVLADALVYNDFRDKMRSFIRLGILADDESVSSSEGKDASQDEPASAEESSDSDISDDEPFDDGGIDFALFADIVDEWDRAANVASSGGELPDSHNHKDDEEEDQLLPFQDDDDDDDDLLPSPSLLQGHEMAVQPESQPDDELQAAPVVEVVDDTGPEDQLEESDEDSLLPQSLLNSQKSIDDGADVDVEDEAARTDRDETPRPKGADVPSSHSQSQPNGSSLQSSQPLSNGPVLRVQRASSVASSLTPAPSSPPSALSSAPPTPQARRKAGALVVTKVNGDAPEARNQPRDPSPAPHAPVEADSSNSQDAQEVEFNDILADAEPVTVEPTANEFEPEIAAPEPAATAEEPVTDTLPPPTPQPRPLPPVRHNQRAFLSRSYQRAEDLTAFAPDSDDELQEVQDLRRPEASARRVTGPRPPIQPRRQATPEPAPRSVSSLRIKQSPRSPDLLLPYKPRKSLPASPLALQRQAPASRRVSSHQAPSAQKAPSSSRARVPSSDRTPLPDDEAAPRAASLRLPSQDAVPAAFLPVQVPHHADRLMVDWDGGPLETDEEYVIPPDYNPKASRLHGKVNGAGFRYARKSGKRRWTDAEELTLYRTLQKVPMSESYPLRVVWYLHGEWGVHSRVLSEFNPQHMKDKMRVIIDRRRNQRLPIVGRARAFLPATDPRRDEFNAEMVHHNELMAELQYQQEQEAEAAIKSEELSEEEDEEAEEDAEEGGDYTDSYGDHGDNDIGVDDAELDELDSDTSDQAYFNTLDSETEEPRRVRPSWAVQQSPPRHRRQPTVEIRVRRRLPGPPVPVPRVSLPGPSRRGKGKRKAPAPPPSEPESEEIEEADIDNTMLAVAADSPQPHEASDEEEDEFYSMSSVSPLRARSVPSSTSPAVSPVPLPRQATRSASRSASRSVSPPVRRSSRNQRGDAGTAETGRVLRSADPNVALRTRQSTAGRRSLRQSGASVRYREASLADSDIEEVAPPKAVEEEVQTKRGRGRPRGSGRKKSTPPVQNIAVAEDDSDGVPARRTRARGRAQRVAGRAVEAPPEVGEVDEPDVDEVDPAETEEAEAVEGEEAASEGSDDNDDDDEPLMTRRKRKAAEALFLPGPETDEDDEDERREVLRRKVMGV